MKRKEYYALSKRGQNVTINIYGNITKYSWWEEDYGSAKLAKELKQYDSVENIDVFINSNGGSVSEGLAIYNILRRHSAKVTTYCDGFACSAASVVFMAGDERIMSNASLLMIHNAWILAQGNAEELRKQADDLDKITEASVNAYMNHVNISEDELKEMMRDETWIDCDEALEKGFCTQIVQEEPQTANQSCSMRILQLLKDKRRVNTMPAIEYRESKKIETKGKEDATSLQVVEKKESINFLNFFKILAEKE